MARELTFNLKKKKYTTVPVRVDRKKLYGWTEILALDENGDPCKLINTDNTGMLMIPKGGTSLGIFDNNGNWIDRSSLITVNADGSPAEVIPSSYSHTIELKDKVSEENFLDYSITDFYQLNTSNDLLKAIGKDIYTFEYTYLDSYDTTTAFIMMSDNTLFMLLGYENKFEMLCLGDCEISEEEDDSDYIFIDDDDIDFSMF